MRRFLLVVPAVLLLAGCATALEVPASTSSIASSVTPSAEATEESDGCIVLSQSALDYLTAALKPGVSISATAGARAPRFEDTTIIAAQLAGDGIAADQSIAIFATTDVVTAEPADGLTLAVGPVAVANSTLTDSSTVLGDITLDETGVQQAVDCLTD
ncbi:hypothetical protein [Naasia lichenicola]|uniref:Uncharacterized protein n=1 Tax=Naasia lichenicola TaxID=2565933 RepID=A0A4S4FKD6_9MICO|nr:hypothetical protein [Naasia lichenicola]THG30809.1 hypothetical protein E6C64_09230 [Naasia lichenicola]